MTIENIGVEIYSYIVHSNLRYHCILFEEKDTRVMLPFERETEEKLVK